MPFEILCGDLVKQQVDVIVNSANPRPVFNEGLDADILRAAGPEMLHARQKIGHIPVGKCAMTEGFALPARYVIHAVGPVWLGGVCEEERLLRQCYENALAMAAQRGCQSIAFPLIATNHYHFPRELALSIMQETVRAFLKQHEMRVLLVLRSRSVPVSEDLESWMDRHFPETPPEERMHLRLTSRVRQDAKYTVLAASECAMPMPEPCAKRAESLDELLEKTDAGFSETLLKLISDTGKKDSEIYSRANVSRQHFSKIRNNPDYRPTKPTAIAFAIALELDLAQTRDLIGRAGYALTTSSKFDVIIMYFIREGNYDIFEINAALFRFDQSLLGV